MTYSPRRGLSIPAATALDAHNRVIEEDQRSIFRHIAQLGAGADIIFGCGTTGEWNRISNAERQKLIRIQAEEVARINIRTAQGPHQVLPASAAGAQSAIAGTGAPRTFHAAPVEAWAGVTGDTVDETLDNLRCAIES